MSVVRLEGGIQRWCRPDVVIDGFDCADVCDVGHDSETRQMVTKGERTKTVMTAGARRQVLAGEAQVLQKERLTRNESTKTGCGVVEQLKKAWNQ